MNTLIKNKTPQINNQLNSYITHGNSIGHYWMLQHKINSNNTTNPSNELKQPKNLGKTSILYLDLPLKFGYKMFDNKLKIDFGLTTSFLIYSEQYILNTERTTLYQEKKDTSNDGLNTILFSLGGEVSYQILKHISVFVQYNRSLTDIYSQNKSKQKEKAKYNLLSLGVSFDF